MEKKLNRSYVFLLNLLRGKHYFQTLIIFSTLFLAMAIYFFINDDLIGTFITGGFSFMLFERACKETKQYKLERQKLSWWVRTRTARTLLAAILFIIYLAVFHTEEFKNTYLKWGFKNHSPVSR